MRNRGIGHGGEPSPLSPTTVDAVTPLARTVTMAAVLVFTIGSDQLTKRWALDRLGDGSTIAIAPTIEFDLLFNTGFSFGTGQGRGQIIGVVVIAMIGYLVYHLIQAVTPRRVILLSAILGGAIGNLIDRIVRADDGALSGAVIDFIDVEWFAVFNLADVYVVCGAILLMVLELLGNQPSEVGADGGVANTKNVNPAPAKHAKMVNPSE